jgi:hypothetical protein
VSLVTEVLFGSSKKGFLMFCSKKVHFVAMLAGLAAAMPTSVRADAYASATAMNGGTAISDATSYGNSCAESHAAANGGTAIARQFSDGRCGGYAHGVSCANTVGGYAEANGMSQANGPYSTACDRVMSSSFCGSSIANGRSFAGPCGMSEAVSTALSQWGPARSDACSEAVHGSAYSDSLAHSFGPFTWTRTYSTGYGACGSPARAASIGVGVGVNFPVFPTAQANAYADFGGGAYAHAADFQYGAH